jgi:hypothetical protein
VTNWTEGIILEEAFLIECKTENVLFSFYYFTVFAFTCMCIHYLGHLPLPTLVSRQNLFHLLFSDFVEEKNIKEKKNMMF